MSLLGDLVDDLLSVDEEEDDPWAVDDPARADWVLIQLGLLKAQEAEDEALVKQLVYEVKTWAENRQRQRADDIRHWESSLQEWHAARLAADPTLRTVELPHGTLQFRKAQAVFNRDPKAILEWLEETIDGLRKMEGKEQDIARLQGFMKRELAWSPLKAELVVKDGKAFVKGTGDMVPSVSVVEPGDEFHATPK